MIGILQYDLNDRDDQFSHRRATKSLAMALALHEFGELLRQSLKEEEDPVAVITLEGLQNEFHSLLDQQGILLEDLIE